MEREVPEESRKGLQEGRWEGKETTRTIYLTNQVIIWQPNVSQQLAGDRMEAWG